jgi:hypothetical protein
MTYENGVLIFCHVLCAMGSFKTAFTSNYFPNSFQSGKKCDIAVEVNTMEFLLKSN